MDTLGQILWYLLFASPIIAIPIALKLSKKVKVRILLWLSISLVLATLCYFLSISILFRGGMGPT